MQEEHHLRMFTKQVSRPVDSLDSQSWPPRPNKGANSKKDLVTGPIGVFVPYRLQAPCTTPRSLSGPVISRRRPVLRSLPTRSLDDRSSRASTGIGCTVSGPQLRDIQVRALWCRAESAFARGDHSDAIGDAERIIALEPFREQANVMLMRAQVDAGNNAEALATYERLCE
jgi:hypothetical protein